MTSSGSNFAGQKREGIKARSMMGLGYIEKHPGKTPIGLPLMEVPASAPAPAPTLKPSLNQALKARKAIFKRYFLRRTDTGDESKGGQRTRPYLI